VKLIDGWKGSGTDPIRSYDVFPDGSFALINRTDLDSGQTTASKDPARFRVSDIHVVLNFVDELRARVK
ncbi:MAG: hypothetical protein ABJC26_14060, partial [Gemmatimonadaceae bacterium]